jgi:hypothetical protein
VAFLKAREKWLLDIEHSFATLSIEQPWAMRLIINSFALLTRHGARFSCARFGEHRRLASEEHPEC